MYYVMSMARLNANSNVLELTHSEIDNNCSFEIYVDDSSDVIPQKLSVSGTTLSVIFDSKPSHNVECRVLIIKGTGLLDGDKVEYDGSVSVNNQLYSVSVGLSDIDTNLRNLTDTVNERVPSQTVLGGVLYHSTTGNTWKKLDAQNLDYDEQSTIYSAMGDIDELETTATNLVGAINEVKNTPVTTVRILSNSRIDNMDSIYNLLPNTNDSVATRTGGGFTAILTKNQSNSTANAVFFRSGANNIDFILTLSYTGMYFGRIENRNVSYVSKCSITTI